LYGRDAHRTRAGVHADGLNKFWWMYAPFNVPQLLGRPLEVSLTKESGLAGLIFVIRQRTGLDLAKDDPRLQKAYEWFMAEFDNEVDTSTNRSGSCDPQQLHNQRNLETQKPGTPFQVSPLCRLSLHNTTLWDVSSQLLVFRDVLFKKRQDPLADPCRPEAEIL